MSNLQLRVFVNAVLGASIGVGIAMLVARYFFPLGHVPPEPPMGILPWVADKIFSNPREKSFYLLSIVLGIGMGSAAARYRNPISWTWPAVFLLGACLILGLNTLISGTLHTLPLGVGVVSVLAWSWLVWQATRREELFDTRIPELPFMQWKIRRPHIVILAGLLFLLMPRSFEAVAANIQFDDHIAPPVVAPALLFYAKSPMIPGIDYYQQYSMGMGWLFHFFLGDTAEQTLINYAVFCVAIVFLFHLCLFYLLWWLYRSWSIAAIVSLMAVLLHFVADRPFSAPSGSTLRYFMLMPAALVFLWWIKQPYRWQRAAALAATVGASLFMSIEIGIYTGIAIACGYLFTRPWQWRNIFLLAVVGLGSIGAFLLMMLAVYGAGILQPLFFYHLVEPLIMYGVVGFGGRFIPWLYGDWFLYYNIAAPGLALATLAYVLAQRKDLIRHDARVAALTFLAVVALLMSVKYVNMAALGVWHVNSLGFLIVSGWWARHVLAAIPQTSLQLRRYRTNLRTAFGAGMACVVFLFTVTDGKYDGQDHVFYSWAHYPGPIQKLWQREGCYKINCVKDIPHPDDVALIARHTEPGDSVAINDQKDWLYLLSAHRPPLSLYIPSSLVFMQRLADETVRRMLEKDRIFLRRGDGKTPLVSSNIAGVIVPAIQRDYAIAATGAEFVMWQRKAPRQAKAP